MSCLTRVQALSIGLAAVAVQVLAMSCGQSGAPGAAPATLRMPLCDSTSRDQVWPWLATLEVPAHVALYRLTKDYLPHDECRLVFGVFSDGSALIANRKADGSTGLRHVRLSTAEMESLVTGALAALAEEPKSFNIADTSMLCLVMELNATRYCMKVPMSAMMCVKEYRDLQVDNMSAREVPPPYRIEALVPVQSMSIVECIRGLSAAAVKLRGRDGGEQSCDSVRFERLK